MKKPLSEMTREELWALFPIILTQPDPRWAAWYEEEAAALRSILPSKYARRIHHIGSTAVQGIWAKPIVDILVEAAPDADLAGADEPLACAGFRCMSRSQDRRSYNKGYTVDGFAERVFHLHLCRAGVTDETASQEEVKRQDEVLFRDWLNAHPEDAKAYEALKLSLWKAYEHDRDGYTAAKSAFVQRILQMAKASK